MPSPDRPNETVLSPWKGRAKALEITERWRLFCDAQVRRLNSPDFVVDPQRYISFAVTTTANAPPGVSG
jgi:hypothetical protein